MDIRELDTQWYWMGYAIGVNMRKSIQDSSNVIKNLGAQGIKTIPNNQQQISFFIGLIAGRRKIIQNLDIIRHIQYQDKQSHKSKGDYLALCIGKIESERGKTETLPLYICNNSVDNRGFAGFQAKIKYNPNYLTLNSITQSSSWTSSFKYQHDATGGVVLIQGLDDKVRYDDIVLAYLSFTVKQTAIPQNVIFLSGPSGTGQGSDILTLINDELYYIMPDTLENGLISLEEIEEDKVYLPPIGDSSSVYGEETDFTYDFWCDLEYAGSMSGGGYGGSGADLVVRVWFEDGSYADVRIPLSEGDNHYQGKARMTLPSIKKGVVSIEMWVEPNDEDDLYYWFIKAGALWGFETEIDREDAEVIPVPGQKKVLTEWLEVYDYIEVYQGGSGPVPPSPAPSYIEIEDTLEVSDIHSVAEFEKLIDMGIEILEVYDYIEVYQKEDEPLPPEPSPLYQEVIDFLDVYDVEDIRKIELVKDNGTEVLEVYDYVEVYQK